MDFASKTTFFVFQKKITQSIFQGFGVFHWLNFGCVALKASNFGALAEFLIIPKIPNYSQNSHKHIFRFIDIIHCVGPIGDKPDLLASCYRTALDTLLANNLRSIAFPCISTGVNGYPKGKATQVALLTVRAWLENPIKRDSVDRIIFCLFMDKDVEIYYQLMPMYFPTQ